jgi:phage terminase large subunit
VTSVVRFDPGLASSDRRKAVEDVRAILEHIVGSYSTDPVGFSTDVLGAKPVASQVDFLRALGRGDRRIAVRSGHRVGKSTMCAWAAIWHLFTRFPQKTVMTAPSAAQLYDSLFSEMVMWVRRLPKLLQDCLVVYKDRIELAAAPESSFISARTSSRDQPQAMAGVHSEHVLLLFDEASDVFEGVFEAASGSMAATHACTVLTGNPRRRTGFFFRVFHELADMWTRFHVSSAGHPLVDPDYVEQQRRTLTANKFCYRVLGDFPSEDEESLISPELVDQAMAREVEIDPKQPLIYGVDVARKGGDRTALCKRRGNVVLSIVGWSKEDTMATVGRIVAEARRDGPALIMVDSIGMGGPVADRLRELARDDRTLGFQCRDVNVSESTALKPEAYRLRDEIWLVMKEWLEARACKLPASEELKLDLTAPTYDFVSSGKTKVESKDEMKARGLRSPDLADALCMTFAGQGAIVGGRGTGWSAGKALKRAHRGVA